MKLQWKYVGLRQTTSSSAGGREALGAQSRPRGVAERAGVGLAFGHGPDDPKLGVACVAVLPEIGVEPDERRLVELGAGLAREVVERQDRGVAGVAAAEREPPAGELGRRADRLAAAHDDDRPEVGVDVAHPEDLRLAAELRLGDDVGGVRVPGDVDLAVQQRVDEALVVGVEDVVGRRAGAGEVLAEALPDRDDARVVGHRADEDRVALMAPGARRGPCRSSCGGRRWSGP